jgi:cytochrome P450
MTEIAITPEGVPIITADPFSLENLAEPHILHEQLREAGPVVFLECYGIWGMARYEQVNATLKNWETFSSAAGAGLSDYSPRLKPGASTGKPTLYSPIALMFSAAFRSRSIERRQQGQ